MGDNQDMVDAPPEQDTERPTGPPAEQQVQRGLRFYAGLSLLVAGLAVLGYVGWQLYGTNIVAERRQQEIVAQTRKAWTADVGATARGEDVLSGAAEALIRIPRFGDDYVMPVLPGVSPTVLAQGFGRFRSSVKPGQVGNYALAAHRVTHGQPLRDMPKLRPGDEVVVETRNRVYTYELDTDPNALVVDFREVWVLDPLPDNPRPGGVEPAQDGAQRLITLTTCAELFNTDNRMIAFGHLVDSSPR